MTFYIGYVEYSHINNDKENITANRLSKIFKQMTGTLLRRRYVRKRDKSNISFHF